ncbi:uncharacterized protein LOC133279803 [Pezoporus flaviventris]|uniref:uncharacterized protein LOC133279803 n=1 Tax=Pezoporus flaviventris TaxID=889875 RepID=UPI002AB22E52|nr:uncharacterized protein LOC133279803 [Pezoporus flaviventris]
MAAAERRRGSRSFAKGKSIDKSPNVHSLPSLLHTFISLPDHQAFPLHSSGTADLTQGLPGQQQPRPLCERDCAEHRKRSRKKPLQKEDDQVLGNDKKGREGGSEELAVELREAKRAPASLIPNALKRDLVLQCSDECSNKRSCTFSMSSLNKTYTARIPGSKANAIASSHSSSWAPPTVDEQKWCECVPSPAFSCSQMPEWPLKNAKEEQLQHFNTSTPVKLDKELQTDNAVETSAQKQRISPSPAYDDGALKHWCVTSIILRLKPKQSTAPATRKKNNCYSWNQDPDMSLSHQNLDFRCVIRVKKE